MTAFAAGPSWSELEILLDVPHTVDPKEQRAVLEAWRLDDLETLAAVRRRIAIEGPTSQRLASRAALETELGLIAGFLGVGGDPA